MYFDIADMASYDDAGDVKKNAYVLEAGDYKIMVGTSVRDNVCAYKYNVPETVITKKCKSYCAPKNLEKRLMADGTYREVPARRTAQKAFAPTYRNEYKPREEIIELLDVAEGKATLDEFISQMSDHDLMALLTGRRSVGICNTGAMGGLFKYRVPAIATADGPAGLRLHPNRGVRTTSFPIATAIAGSWNTALAEEIGAAAALECKENNLQIWLAPALNIHRNPLCGRNFEYYSEDPLVAGKMAAAMVRGIQAQRVVATPKHFAANNKETNRLDSDSVMSERALREIYLRGFEICVKESAPKLIMSSYNLINGVRASECAELITGILRGEWGYEGAVTTDWSNHAENYKEVKAGNDIRMPMKEKLLDEAYEAGLISRDEMASCVKRVLEMILWVE
jgi:beta-glucosidase